MVLAQDEIDACREAFLAFDKDRCVYKHMEQACQFRHIFDELWSVEAAQSTCGSFGRSWKVIMRLMKAMILRIVSFGQFAED